MRCKNCGWENDPNRTNCEKCNAPLISQMGDNEMNPMNPVGEINLKGTIPEGEIFTGGVSSPMNSVNQTPQRCSKCGYPIGRGMNVCPQCGTPIQKGNSGQHQGTVNPWITPERGTFCTLKPITWENEQTEHNAMTYSGSNIVLNRANTDPNNQTITSQEQAELICENGEWHICDKSAQKTTYVHAGRKTKLENGDIIILGNRQFVFNC